MKRVAIIGTGQTPHVSHRTDRDEPEVLAEAVRRALADAEVQPREIEAVVFGSAISSIQEGIEHIGKWASDFVCGWQRPSFRVHTGGTVGMAAALGAIAWVASGGCDTALAVAGTLRMGATGAASQKALSLASDPIYRRGFSGGAVLGLALTFRQYMEWAGVTERDAARCVVQQRRNAARNPNAHLREPVTEEEVLSSRPLALPIKLLDMCPTSVGSAAVIVASEARARQAPSAAWIRGFGSFAEPSSYPERNTMEALSVRESAKKAYAMASIRNPREDLDVVELYNAASYQQMHWSEALGLCEPRKGGELFRSGDTDFPEEGRRRAGQVPINPSGGVLATNNGSDAALLRLVEATLQVTHKAGDHQVREARTAAAMGWGGNQQFTSVVVVGANPP